MKRYEVQKQCGYAVWSAIGTFAYSEEGKAKAEETLGEARDGDRYATFRLRVEGYRESAEAAGHPGAALDSSTGSR
jgi:hypothetical protein